MKIVRLLLLVLPLLQQPAIRAEVRVQLIDGLDGQPIPRARYAVTGGGMIDALTGSGDPKGNVTVSDLNPGRYLLTVDKAGYFQERLEFNVSTASADLPNLVMTSKREISGVVRWQDGELAAGASVQVLPVRGGKAATAPAGGSNTNARGEFVLSGLRPGRYILLVNPPPQRGAIDATGRFVIGGVPRISLPVYYPGISVADVSASIDLRGTLSVPNIGIVLDEKPGTVVEGTIQPSAAAPLGSDVAITLNYSGMSSSSARVRSGDTFRIGPVPAGFYFLDAQSLGEQRSRAVLGLTLGGDALRGVNISIPPPAFLSGRLEIDDPRQAPAVPVRIQADRIPGLPPSSAIASGEFRIPMVVPGEIYRLTVDLGRFPNVYLAQVSQGPEIKPASPFVVQANEDPVRIVLKTDGGTLNGVAKDGGRVVPKAFVVLAPKDRKLEQLFRVATAGDDGVYKLSGIAPGAYDLFAFDRNEDDDYLDAVFLNKVAEHAVTVNIALRSTASVDLNVFTLPRR